MIVDQARRVSPDLAVRFDATGWQALQEAALIRNRVTHPKSTEDMVITPADLVQLRAGMAWLLATAEYVMARTNLSFGWFNEQMRDLLSALRSGDSEALAEYRSVSNDLDRS